MSEDIVGRGRLEPTQPPGTSFEVDCDIRFSSTVQGDSRGFPPTVDTRCARCVVRRMDSQPIPDGLYTLHINHDGTSESLQLKRMNGGWYPLGERSFSRHSGLTS
jgi:hypothetical protein